MMVCEPTEALKDRVKLSRNKLLDFTGQFLSSDEGQLSLRAFMIAADNAMLS